MLRAVAPIHPEEVVFGQYARGQIDGREGVPFYLRTGKRMPQRTTQIAVTFRCPPVSVFQPFDYCDIHSNVLIITLQPDEGFDLCFEVKAPGDPITLETHRLHFRYAEAYAPLPDAYETLLLDILTGDQTLFVRADEVEAAWRLHDPLLKHRPPPVQPYPAGTWGSREAYRPLRGSRLADGVINISTADVTT